MTDPDTQPAQQEAVEEKAEVKQVSIVVLDLHLVLIVLSMMWNAVNMVEENLAFSSWGEKWLWLLAHKTAQYSRLQMIIDQIELMTFAVESFYYLKAYIIVGKMMTGGINHYQPRDWWVVNIPSKMPVDQVKEEEEPAKEVIATKVNLNKLSKPSSSRALWSLI